MKIENKTSKPFLQMQYDNVRLKFSDEALHAVARQAIQRHVGARGLMMILEELLLDAMYELPSQRRVKEFIITKEMVEHRTTLTEIMAEVDDAAA